MNLKRIRTIEDPRQMTTYLSDESRLTGRAGMIFLPKSEEEVRQILREQANAPVRIQGARTGLTAACVPMSGDEIVISLEGMSKILSIDYRDREGGKPFSGHRDDGPDDFAGNFNDCPAAIVRLQPGAILFRLRETLGQLGLFFPTDPTESSASIGGMVANNSSGARSFRYGSIREHVESLRIVLADGDLLELRRGRHKVDRDGSFTVRTEGGRILRGELPVLPIRNVSKNTAGYYIRPGMDLLDLFIGSEGTLGIVTEIGLRVYRGPREIWGAVCFLPTEDAAIRFTEHMRKLNPTAIEYFDGDGLLLLRSAQRQKKVLTDMQEIPEEAGCAVYVEFFAGCKDMETREAADAWQELIQAFRRTGECMISCGGDPGRSWAAISPPEMEKLKAFRHSLPVCVNEQIEQTRRTYPAITKLGTDMSVPRNSLGKALKLYRDGLSRQGFSSVIFGHIGDSHLHVNIIPRSEEEYHRGKELYTRWAKEITAMGGSVSAEHGIGRLKPWLLRIMYTEEELNSMFRLKMLFDPELRLNRDNIFGGDR